MLLAGSLMVCIFEGMFSGSDLLLYRFCTAPQHGGPRSTVEYMSVNYLYDLSVYDLDGHSVYNLSVDDLFNI